MFCTNRFYTHRAMLDVGFHVVTQARIGDETTLCVYWVLKKGLVPIGRGFDTVVVKEEQYHNYMEIVC